MIAGIEASNNDFDEKNYDANILTEGTAWIYLLQRENDIN